VDPNGNFWLFGGIGIGANSNFGSLNELWKFTPYTGQWTWMSGSGLTNPNIVYGTLGVPAAGNNPGGRQ
jgi:hypothetical protein